MRIVILTDSHAGMRNNSLIFMEHQIAFYEKQFFPFVQEHKIDYLIHLGDIFECRPSTNNLIFEEWDTRVFSKWNELFKEVHVLIGNHDIYFKNTIKINAPERYLSKYPNFKFYSSPQEINLFGMNTLILPWICKGNEEQSIQLINNSMADLVLGHLEIMGCPMFKGIENIDHGFEQSTFKRFKKVLSGHFHLKSNQGNIEYLGSPHARMWEEAFDSRGFHVMDSTSLKLKFFEIQTNPFVALKYEDSSKADIPDVESKMVQITIEKKTSESAFLQWLQEIENRHPAEISIEDKVLNMSLNDSPTESLDLFSLIDYYVESLEFETPKADLKRSIREIYHEAITLHDIAE